MFLESAEDHLCSTCFPGVLVPKRTVGVAARVAPDYEIRYSSAFPEIVEAKNESLRDPQSFHFIRRHMVEVVSGKTVCGVRDKRSPAACFTWHILKTDVRFPVASRRYEDPRGAVKPRMSAAHREHRPCPNGERPPRVDTIQVNTGFVALVVYVYIPKFLPEHRLGAIREVTRNMRALVTYLKPQSKT